MKRTFFLLATSLLCVLSFAQQTNSDTIDLARRDILLFKFLEPNVELIEPYLKRIGHGVTTPEIYRTSHLVVATNVWRGYGYEYIYKVFGFTRGADTMVIEMNCGQERNFDFKNMKFQKGNYVIRLEDKYNHQTIGDSVTNDAYLLNLYLANTYKSKEGEDGIYLRDVEFFEIDMLNSENVKWREATKDDSRIWSFIKLIQWVRKEKDLDAKALKE